MANPYKFPIFKPILQFKEDEDFKKIGDRDFVGSIRRRVITTIKALRCANKCEDKDGQMRGILLMDDKDSPMTGHCGHLFCSGCAKKLYDNSKPSSRPSPKLIVVGKFEFDCALTSNPILYNCKSCFKDIKCDKKEKKHIVRAFSENIMFRDLFIALKSKSGFHCEKCKADKVPDFHPKFNSLKCIKCGSMSEDRKPYFCIWHFPEHRKEMEKQGDYSHGPKILHSDDEETDESQPLSSLDRRNRKVFAALYHCACCSTPLEKDITRFRSTHHHLECGHFIGARCVENARKKLENRMNKGLESLKNRIKRGDEDKGYEGSADQLPEGLYCNFCKKDPIKKSDLNVYPVFPPLDEILKGGIHTHDMLECKANCEECKFTACKTLFAHPRLGKPPRDRCLWCEIEHLLVKKCNEKNNH